MNQLEHRLRKIEFAAKNRNGDLSLLTDVELEARIDTVLERMGTSREQVIAEHGSLTVHRDYLREQQRARDGAATEKSRSKRGIRQPT